MPQRLALPLTVSATGQLASLTQDAPTEVAQSVGLLLATRPGERRSVPDYGTPNPLGVGVSREEITAAIEEWEDRADPATVEITTTGDMQDVDVYPADPGEELFA